MDKPFQIVRYSPAHFSSFKELFNKYFLNDLEISLSDEQLNKTCTEVGRLSDDCISPLDLLIVNGAAIGFIEYQIDSAQSNWCEKEGWGFIRELHVAPDFRRKGLGKALVTHAEGTLVGLSAQSFYLTSSSSAAAQAFWVRMGYRDSGTLSTLNGQPIFIK